jgi:hypothetical protein
MTQYQSLSPLIITYTVTLVKSLFRTRRVLKNSLVTCFIGPFSYENLGGQGTFSTPSFSFVKYLQRMTAYANLPHFFSFVKTFCDQFCDELLM